MQLGARALRESPKVAAECCRAVSAKCAQEWGVGARLGAGGGRTAHGCRGVGRGPARQCPLSDGPVLLLPGGLCEGCVVK